MDSVEIKIRAGRGGNGLISFWREKFQPFGGPDGGDGGKGGDIYLIADENTTDMSTFRHNRKFKAGDGIIGGRQKKHGRNGEDIIIKVPVGTTVYRIHEGEKTIAIDLTENRRKLLAAKGGRGGMGNVHFATSTNQVPKKATPGATGEEAVLLLEYTIPCDAAIIGLPNCGKSSLLFKMTGVAAKVADYPFTTVEPVLGRAEAKGRLFTIAEMPALMEGSAEGKGLGNAFLRHSLRARSIVLLLDGSSTDVARDFKVLENELQKFSPDFMQKQVIIAVNKTDLPEVIGKIPAIKRQLLKTGRAVYFISALSGEGVAEMLDDIASFMGKEAEPESATVKEEVVFRPRPKRRREPR